LVVLLFLVVDCALVLWLDDGIGKMFRQSLEIFRVFYDMGSIEAVGSRRTGAAGGEAVMGAADVSERVEVDGRGRGAGGRAFLEAVAMS
jgi:hypothetical protein